MVKKKMMALIALLMVFYLTACAAPAENTNHQENSSVSHSQWDTEKEETAEEKSQQDQTPHAEASNQIGEEGVSPAEKETVAPGASSAESMLNDEKASNKPEESAEPAKPSKTAKPASTSKPKDTSKPGKPASTTKPTESTKPAKPQAHVHNWVDQGTGILMDWSAADQENTGATSNSEEVTSISVCARCGYFYGRDNDLFKERYWKHMEDQPSHQSYTVVSVEAVYHLLECSGCGAYKRGEFAFYQTGLPGDLYHLTAAQAKELGL